MKSVKRSIFKSLLASLILNLLILGQASAAPAIGISNTSGSRDVESIRSGFEKLELEMVGMTTFMGETSAFIRTERGEIPQRFDIGDTIGSYRIVSIQTGYVIFERSGVRLWLPLGERDVQDADNGNAPQGTREGGEVSHKVAATDLKIRTRNFETASVTPPGGFLPSSLSHSSAGPIGVFAMPIKGVVTSPFGYRKRPTGGARRYHRGVDIAAAYGTSIRAAAAGKVTKVSRSWAKGLNIEIQHAGGYTTEYFHLHKALVSEGESVAQGEVIGQEGTSGNSTGPHLHFEIHKNGQAVNPALYLRQLN